ncbi:putative F-box protein [Cardamine amara subsp. amara]|uniref:F-box protein n=1 Tax=Cardamine amara subsp. amara TaxID=228776 RepID=A0ABD0ZQW2_CARAN
MIKELRNVEILDLSSIETMKIFYKFRQAIPMFENLSRLSIATKSGLCWKLLTLLLEKSPNLETLVIKGPLHYHEHGQGICECLSEYHFLLSCLVKVVEITEFRGTKRELAHMKHILVKLPCLELVKVHAWETDENAKLKITMNLLKLLRPCKIQLKFVSC